MNELPLTEDVPGLPFPITLPDDIIDGVQDADGRSGLVCERGVPIHRHFVGGWSSPPGALLITPSKANVGVRSRRTSLTLAFLLAEEVLERAHDFFASA